MQRNDFFTEDNALWTGCVTSHEIEKSFLARISIMNDGWMVGCLYCLFVNRRERQNIF
jgi:hypothetical protein